MTAIKDCLIIILLLLSITSSAISMKKVMDSQDKIVDTSMQTLSAIGEMVATEYPENNN